MTFILGLSCRSGWLSELKRIPLSIPSGDDGSAGTLHQASEAVRTSVSIRSHLLGNNDY